VEGQRHYLSPEAAAGLQAARRRLGLSFREASERAGVSTGFLWNLEHGKRCPSIDMARCLIAAFDLDAVAAARLLDEARPDVGRSFIGAQDAA
jgi:transcriptional regulator with XRE-family HTH domain